MNPPTIPRPEPPGAWPPRYWWLKRICLGSVLGLAVFGGLVGWFVYESHRRLDAEVAAIHARGEPVLQVDFLRAPVPDSENAAITLKAAFDSITLSQGLLDAADDESLLHGGAGAYIRTQAPNITAGMSKARQLAHAARSQNRFVSVQRNPGNPVPLILAIEELITLERSLVLLAVVEQDAGKTDSAVEALRDAMHIANLTESHPSLTNAHAVASFMRRQIREACSSISDRLQLRPDDPAGEREALRGLIDDLLDEAPMRAGLETTWIQQRADVYQAASQGAGGTLSGYPMPGWTSWLAPLFRMDGARMIHEYTLATAASRGANDFPTASAATAPTADWRQLTVAGEVAHVLRQMMSRDFRRIVADEFEAIADQRVTAMRLAITLYRAEHNGALPDRLAQLVPDYLPSLPSDPFAADGRPFGFRRESAPMLYSVGHDGIDGQGDITLPPGVNSQVAAQAVPGSSDDYLRHHRRDMVFLLNDPSGAGASTAPGSAP